MSELNNSIFTGRYLLGQDGDEDGEGAVEVEEGEKEPDPSDQDQAVPVEDDHQHRRHDGEHQQDLAHVQRPALTTTTVNRQYYCDGTMGLSSLNIESLLLVESAGVFTFKTLC